MANKIFVRDNDSIDYACRYPFRMFAEKYKETNNEQQLLKIYDSIRRDAKKDPAWAGKIIHHYEGDDDDYNRAKKTELANEHPDKHKKSTVQPAKKEEPVEGEEIDLSDVIAKLHKKGFNMPKTIKAELERLYTDKQFTIEEIRKVHYKLLGK